ncbi:MAG: FimV/HubP family polar landmark protein [Pseudomonadota bacterium]|nr:FimV/HubP family polar landmark protein [Pseudomonadota bacterium]
MVRKLAAAMLGVGVFIPGLANALGLGEIKLNSALSEPLDAEIELVQLRELTPQEILPSLAVAEDFEAANVERYHFLTDLKFEVTNNEQGKPIIKVRSRKPVKEPFVNFLVEVNWPAGRLLREYTLLLDPPVYSAQPAASVTPAQSGGQAPAATRTVPTYQAEPQTRYSSGDYAQGATQGGGTYTIGPNDSLWGIARQMKPSDRVSIQQTMMAIQRLNPDAFIDGNINLLKRGAVLRAPSEQEAMELTNREAIALAAEQNRQWQQRLQGAAANEPRQIDLSGRSVSREQEPGGAAEEDRLQLVSGGASGSGDSAQGGTGVSGELRDQLAVAEENVDKFRRENEDLKLRLNDLEDQLDTSEKVLTLKDEQIAALQAKLRELEAMQSQQQADSGPADATATAEPPAMAAEGADTAGQDLSAEAAETTMADAGEAGEIPASELIAPDAGASVDEVDYNFQQEQPELDSGLEDSTADAAASDAESAGAEMSASAEDAMAGEPAVATPSASESEPVATTPPPVTGQQQDLMSKILANPLYLAAGGGAVLLLVVLGLIAARRKQSESVEEEAFPEDLELPEAQESEPLMELDSVNLEEDDAFEEAVEASAEEETVPQTSDVIGEADIYIAYGRFPQAIEMLEKAVEAEPQRADIRLKLCEVSAEANEPEVFMNHYRVLQEVGTTDEISRADNLRQKLGPMAESDGGSESDAGLGDADDTLLTGAAAQNFDFDDMPPASSEETSSLDDALEQESDTGLDFDLSDLEDTGARFDSDAGTGDAATDEHSEEVAGLDFDLNLDLDDDQNKAPGGDQTEALDFDLDSPAESAPQAGSGDSDATALDFDTEFSLDDADSQEQTATDSSEFNMDFDTLDTGTEDRDQTAPSSGDDETMDFDLDFDSSTTELDEPPTLDFSDDETLLQPPAESQAPAEEPAAEEPAAGMDFETPEPSQAEPEQGGEEPMLDSQSAAQLASELDLDGDFLDGGEQNVDSAEPPVMDEPPVAPAANDGDDSGEELDFLSDADEASTKLDLARAYIDMGDRDGAKDILDEVMLEGNDNQKDEARELLTRLEA